MPELPEVEVSRLGISPHLQQQRIEKVLVRQRQLRWLIPDEVLQISHQPVLDVTRRAKYLLIHLPEGELIIHLGMSGHLKVVPQHTAAGKHDHVDIYLSNGLVLRLNDTRRFGAVLWQPKDTMHTLMASLGPEPLLGDFHGAMLLAACQKRSSAIKLVLMDNHVVVGVGNIYANEALFQAGIHPKMPANQLSAEKAELLVQVVKQILAKAITQGGTTLKDFSQTDGKPGYFAQQLLVYGRGGEECFSCQTELKEIRLGQRSTVYCPACQGEH
ncbi:MAG: bifunctional DNA-formamidopyrimidine glycosylase/DNA-(apurinic or apyrimidinic site) lyase [Pararheinheimera sp.]|nr:bifunctional DNA-formamidopyrimidine glycosylase/DNA-(apurinic or apyrimidinic site) lyase [Rheinheimera sp.]